MIMKKAVLMAAVILMTPILTLAQSRWSVSPAIGFYKAELDAISDGLSRVQTIGATVQKPNGGLHFGGRLHYEKSPRWSWLAEVSLWKDKGTGSLQNESISDQVRLVPIMVGSQYYFSQPAAKTRFYAGATGGLVLVNVESEYRLGTLSQTADLSGNSVVTKPFVGLEIANTSKMSFWGELGYMLGKYTIEGTNAATGAKIEEDVSINGIHVTGGVKFRL
jgi:hypothetical protein